MYSSTSSSLRSLETPLLFVAMALGCLANACAAPDGEETQSSEDELRQGIIVSDHVEGTGDATRHVVTCADGREERFRPSDFPLARLRGIACATRPTFASPEAYVRSEVEGDTQLSAEQLYAVALGDGSLSDVLRGHGPLIPAVARTEPLTPTWGVPGSRRLVVFSDGNMAIEELIETEQDRGFRYAVWKFTSPATLAIDHALAEFRYEPAADGAHIRWTYGFLPRNELVRPLVNAFVSTQYHPFMEETLALIVAWQVE
jgi:hypothetical protein